MRKSLSPGSLIIMAIFALLILCSCATAPPTADQMKMQEQFRRAEMNTWSSAGLLRKEIQVDGDRIVYLEGGHGETLLLLHGYTANKDFWTAFAKELTPMYHVVIPDLAGFGESTRDWHANYSIESQVKRLERFAQALQLQKFHLAGNSMGGEIAAVYASEYPKEISTLALIDPSGLQTAKWTQLWSQMMNGNNPFLVRNTDDFERVLSYCYVTPPQYPAPIKSVIVAQCIADRSFNEKVGSDLFQENLALEPLLPTIQAPVLIVWGDRDRIFDVSDASILEKGLKNHQTVIIKDTGHVPMMEKPAETATVYVNFLKNHRSM